MEEQGLLKPILIFEQVMKGFSSSLVPDYLEIGEGESGIVPPMPVTFPCSAAAAGFAEPLDAPVHDMATLLESGEVTPVELVEASLARIQARGTLLNAFQIRLDDEARMAALRAEKELAAGDCRGKLHGIPVAIKDNLDLAGSPTAAGSVILGRLPAIRDSDAVARLKEAGAIIVGKTRMSEFAYSPGSNNDHFGPTGNPHDPGRDTGGSSSGSAAAVAGRMVSLALGTDTGGSIRIPASYCGLVGLKPSHGRLSLAGSVPLSWSLDHLGPLARDVEDAAILYDGLCRPAFRKGQARAGKAAAPGLAIAADAGLKGIRVGILRDDGSGRALASDEVLFAWRRGNSALAAAGAEILEIDLPELQALRALNATLLAIEAAAFHAPTMRGQLSGYGAFPRLRLLAGWAYGPSDFVRVSQARAALRVRCEGIWRKIDILCTPTTPSEAPTLGTPGRLNFTSPFNILGWPAISLPSGRSVAGLPLGLQLIGKPWDEARLFLVAAVAERGMPIP